MTSKKNIPDWNKEGVWNNVEDRLQQKKKRRFLYWSFFGAASTVLLIGFLMCLNTIEDTNISWNKNLTSKLEQKTGGIPNCRIFFSEMNDSLRLCDSVAMITDNLGCTQKTSLKEIQNNFPLENPIELNKRSKQNSESGSQQIKYSPRNEQRSGISNIKYNSAVIQSEELVAETPNLKREGNTSVVSISPNISFEKVERESVVDEKFEPLYPLSILPNDLSPINFKESELSWVNNITDSLSQKKEKKKASTAWWVASGISIGNKSLMNPEGDFTTEQFRLMQTNTIGLQRSLNKNWSLNLGLAYQTIYEKYEYLSSSIHEEDFFSEEAVVYHLSDGINYFEPGLATQSTTSTRFIIHNNFIHRLSVPVELAYAFKKNHWSLAPSLGFRFQFFQRFDGIIAQGGDHLFDLGEINDIYYSNNLSMGLITALNLKCHIFSKASLGLSLTYERDDFLNLIENEFFPKYETIGLRLGYYHSF